jgi:hypothetical protein
MPVKDCATLEAEIAKGEPPRLLIEIKLCRPLVGAPPAYDSAEIQRAIRDGFQEIAAQGEIQRLTIATRPPKSRLRRWVGRIVAFTFCAVIGSAVNGDSVGLSHVALLRHGIVDPAGLRRSGGVDRISESRLAIAGRTRRSVRLPLGLPSRPGDVRLAHAIGGATGRAVIP